MATHFRELKDRLNQGYRVQATPANGQCGAWAVWWGMKNLCAQRNWNELPSFVHFLEWLKSIDCRVFLSTHSPDIASWDENNYLHEDWFTTAQLDVGALWLGQKCGGDSTRIRLIYVTQRNSLPLSPDHTITEGQIISYTHEEHVFIHWQPTRPQGGKGGDKSGHFSAITPRAVNQLDAAGLGALARSIFTGLPDLSSGKGYQTNQGVRLPEAEALTWITGFHRFNPWTKVEGSIQKAMGNIGLETFLKLATPTGRNLVSKCLVTAKKTQEHEIGKKPKRVGRIDNTPAKLQKALVEDAFNGRARSQPRAHADQQNRVQGSTGNGPITRRRARTSPTPSSTLAAPPIQASGSTASTSARASRAAVRNRRTLASSAPNNPPSVIHPAMLALAPSAPINPPSAIDPEMLAADGDPGPNTLRQVVYQGAENDLQEQARFLAEQEAALELEQDASEGDVVAPRITAPPGIAAENRLAEEAALIQPPRDTVEGDVLAPVAPRLTTPPGDRDADASDSSSHLSPADDEDEHESDRPGKRRRRT